MWDVNTTYRKDLDGTFSRLLDKVKVLNAARPLPNIVLQNIKEALLIEWTYNSNSIEGNTLSLRETQMVLQEGVTIKGKSLREHFEAKNHETAIHKFYALVRDDYVLNAKDILELHGLVLRSIEDDYAGRLRNAGVRISGANFVPPNARKVSEYLDSLIHYINNNPQELNPIELATVFHHKFVWIHPFFDGNGRTIRLAMNLLLMRHGFPPAIILANDRAKYYAALNQANTGNYSKLMLLMGQACERSLNIYMSAIPGSDKNYQAISNIVEEPEVPYSQEYVSLLARQGKIDAHKEGRNWYTTKEAVLSYMSAKGK
ncbi:Fic family protein [Winogradskyella psychrotolerans]|uniref:Fic family protein n=1 Tax=Winogradskyella psychrotolerans TaxID=1344585 RepID=UPI001C076146|nr:Fic family protein [Winogradskyella psychrotolerans]MBU2930273.1 Fic family protein [Winogradskyella psychrotolerans]